MAQIGSSCKRALLALAFLPGLGWASYQPVSGSTVTVVPYNNGTLPVSGTLSVNTHAVTQSGNWNVGLVAGSTLGSSTMTVVGTTLTVSAIQGSLPAGSNGLGNVNIVSTNTLTTSASQSGTWNVGLIAGSSLTNSTFTVVGTTIAVVGPSNGAILIQGNVASGASDSGNPVKQGAVGRTTYQTAVTDGQRVDVQADSEGKQVNMPFAVPALSTNGVTSAMTGTSQGILISSGGANINTYLTSVSCFNSHATVGTVINIRNGNVLKYTGYAVAAGGGFTMAFPTPIPPNTTNAQWTAENATNGSNTYCNATGFFAKN